MNDILTIYNIDKIKDHIPAIETIRIENDKYRLHICSHIHQTKWYVNIYRYLLPNRMIHMRVCNIKYHRLSDWDQKIKLSEIHDIEKLTDIIKEYVIRLDEYGNN